ITTYRGSVPQGGCNSSYLANLVLFNSEYNLVSKLRGQGIRYSRLLDDITISSEEKLSEDKISSIIREVAGMLRKHNLRLNSDKTKITYRSVASSKMEVTGLWVKHKKPKVKKSERRYIRQLVYICEKKAMISKTSVEYHEFWNKVSGLVAKIDRLEHPQAKDYRLRLRKILPIYNEAKCKQIIDSVSDTLKINKSKHNELSTIKRVNRLLYQLSILSRTEKSIARNQRVKLKKHFNKIISEKYYWEES
ncbi:RNA-directed DNA polymerase, partial [Photobacterium damselae]|nr:RNA-directed DNA polymerase [Photobacterium damselae]